MFAALFFKALRAAVLLASYDGHKIAAKKQGYANAQVNRMIAAPGFTGALIRDVRIDSFARSEGRYILRGGHVTRVLNPEVLLHDRCPRFPVVGTKLHWGSLTKHCSRLGTVLQGVRPDMTASDDLAAVNRVRRS